MMIQAVFELETGGPQKPRSCFKTNEPLNIPETGQMYHGGNTYTAEVESWARVAQGYLVQTIEAVYLFTQLQQEELQAIELGLLNLQKEKTL